ncbi:hypothetical protein [Novosphingobium aquimarinum]|uniref:hypothetical protein n=1 Tax=Novosphingobium aquimarinum TaxID=2682494 RepID=UPI0012EB2BE7|nr:hypothetical protein [Novosphingobium aquimarinum]
MPDQTLAIPSLNSFAFKPQDRRIRPTLGNILSTALSLVVVAAAVYQARDLDLARIVALVPTSVIFWVLFTVRYLAGPASEWVIFHRLWGVGPSAFGALVRKLIYNELLIGYLGEAYFYGWARRNLKFVTTPFGAVKDVAVLSAVAGNAATLVFLAITYPFVKLLPLHDHATAIGWSLAFVIGTSLGITLFRGSIFSLERGELRMVFALHLTRIVITTVVSAALWHLVLPDVAVGWWLLLVTIRLLVSRLPFVPNKDVVFAGIAVLAVGSDVETAALMALMAGLILVTHVVVGMSFAFTDLFSKGKFHAATAP